MKIALITNSVEFINFYINLARYLTASNHSVYFCNPDNLLTGIYKKFHFNVIHYNRPTKSKAEGPFNENSKAILYYQYNFKVEDTNKLIKQKNLEYCAAKEVFEQEHFDAAIFLNGIFDVEHYVCQDLGVRSFYFEHGYFPNTIQMDHHGVNKDASYCDFTLPEFLSFRYPEADYRPLNNFNLVSIKVSSAKRTLSRLFDSKYASFRFNLITRGLNIKKARKDFNEAKDDHLNLNKIGKYIFVALQVNTDTQIIFNSPFKSVYHALETVMPDLLGTGYNIILKEHPHETSPVDYSTFVDNKKTFITRKHDLDELMEKAEFVVCINSSVGLQAVCKNKKLLLLGDAFYKNIPTVVEYGKLNKVGLREHMENIEIEEHVIENIIDHYLNHIFIKGHFSKPTVDFLERIKCRIEGK